MKDSSSFPSVSLASSSASLSSLRLREADAGRVRFLNIGFYVNAASFSNASTTAVLARVHFATKPAHSRAHLCNGRGREEVAGRRPQGILHRPHLPRRLRRAMSVSSFDPSSPAKQLAVSANSKSSECYLGLLYALDDVAVYGYTTPTRLKLVIAFTTTDSLIKDSEVSLVGRRRLGGQQC